MKSEYSDVMAELEVKYKNKSVIEIVNDTKEAIKTSGKFYKEAINNIWYLQEHDRFKKYPGYQKSKFEIFLANVFFMTDKKYRAYRIAYNRYPKETEFFGIGIVERVMRECGSENSASVFEKFWEYTQKKNWNAEGLQEIINKNSRIKKKAKKIGVSHETDWRKLYEEEHKKCLEALQIIDGLKIKLVEAYTIIKFYEKRDETIKERVEKIKKRSTNK